MDSPDKMLSISLEELVLSVGPVARWTEGVRDAFGLRGSVFSLAVRRFGKPSAPPAPGSAGVPIPIPIPIHTVTPTSTSASVAS